MSFVFFQIALTPIFIQLAYPEYFSVEFIIIQELAGKKKQRKSEKQEQLVETSEAGQGLNRSLRPATAFH